MLIIFDLDDTIIDTTGSITPLQLQLAIAYMQKKGVKLESPSSAFYQIQLLDQYTESGKETLRIFLAQKNSLHLEKELLEKYYSQMPDLSKIQTLPKIKVILQKLSMSYQLALASKGFEKIQLEKLEKAGIDREFFSKICIAPSDGKEKLYQEIFSALGAKPEETVVVGDRVRQDLLPAKKLGCYTIHMKWGRGNRSITSSQVDASVSLPEELPEQIATLVGGIKL